MEITDRNIREQTVAERKFWEAFRLIMAASAGFYTFLEGGKKIFCGKTGREAANKRSDLKKEKTF